MPAWASDERGWLDAVASGPPPHRRHHATRAPETACFERRLAGSTLACASVMPGSTHEGIRLLFQNRPSLVRELLERAGVVVPGGEMVEDANAFSDLAPPSYSADLVAIVRGPLGPSASFIVEVQNAEDHDKHYAWPRYAATEHALRRCPTWVVIIATSRRVAEWARRPIRTFQPGHGFVPMVIGPEDVPRITDLATAEADPELAVLSAVFHGMDDDGSIAVPAMEVARALDTERRRPYTDLVFGSLGAIARAAVEAIMRERNYEPLTEIGRQMLERGRVEGRVEALQAACAALGIEWSAEHRAAVEPLDAAALEALLGELLRTRRWPTH